MCSHTNNSEEARISNERWIFPLKKKTDIEKKNNYKYTVKCNFCYGIVAEQ